MSTLFPRVNSVGGMLLTAEAAAIAAQNTEQFVLVSSYRDARAAGIAPAQAAGVKLDVTPQVVTGRLNLTIEGASTLTLGLHDPDWVVEGSGLLDLDDDGRMGDIDLSLNGIWFRLVKASRQDPQTLSLTFEDLTVAVLRDHRKPMKASRNSMTRAQFIEKMVNELPGPLRLFYSPEKDATQETETPKYPDATPAEGQTGFDKNVSFKIQGVSANASQKREVATVLAVCDQLNVSPLVRQAIIVAGLGESGFVPTRVSTAGAKGVFQLMPSWWSQIDWRDTEKQARHFIQDGFYRYGSATTLARENPQMSPGEIASRVEGSATDGQNASYYNGYLAEAKKIIALWQGGTGATSPDTVFRLKTYQFTRGLPGRKESSWDSASRLAQEVNWRFYVAGGVVVFASDDWLISRPAQITLKSPFDPELLDRPGYDWDHGKTIGETTLQVEALRWAVRPGNVVVLDNKTWGPIQGRWLVETVDQDLFQSSDCTVTLVKPIKPRKEPAAEVITETSGDNEPGTGSIVYVGDSLGVGTLPYFRRALGRKSITNDVLTGRTSLAGVAALEDLARSRRFDNIVFDLGTNDSTAAQLKASIQKARRIAPEARIYVLTVNGPNDAAKNKMLRAWSDGHVHLIDWKGYADRAGLALDSLGIHPTSDGYKKRAGLIARAMGFA